MVSVIPESSSLFHRSRRLVGLMVLVLAVPTLPAASVSAGNRPAPTPSFDFSDEFYRQQGLAPEKIQSRISPDSGLAVLSRCADPGRRGIRALEVRGGYDAAGCPVYFHRFGALGEEGFAPGPAGKQARAIAQEFRVFRFPSRKASVSTPTLIRQDPVFDTTPGSLGRNPLGLWQVTTVVFTEKVFRSQAVLAAMEEIRKRNGTDLDGTPLLKHLSEIQLLDREGYVRLAPGTLQDSTSSSWMIGPLLEDPQRDGFADDAFLTLVTMDEGSPVDPMIEQTFLCLAQSGIYGASRMPRLPAFVQSLPIPPDLRPRERSESVGTGPVSVFELHERPFQHRFHPDLPPSTLWGYEGMFPGPTLRVRRGDASLLRIRNELPPDGGGGVGQPRTACRVGLSESAGTPEDHFGPGESKDYPVAALRASARYRDGRLGFGAQNVYKGLAGFLISTDPVDSGDGNDPNPRALRLPGGPCDVPLLLADRRFGVTLDHPLAWNPFSMTGCPDDYVTVNGAVQPYFKVARRKYRFRIWNAGPSRAYELSLSNRLLLILLAVDGYLLEAPVERTDLRLAADQLRDVVIDFSRVPLGTEVYLEDQTIPGPVRANPLPGIPRPPFRILKFLVDRDAPDPSRVPSQLGPGPREAVPLDLPTRTFAFADGRGVWTLNGKSFDLGRADAVGKPGAREVWILKNESKDQTLALRLTAEGRLPGVPASLPWESGPRSVTELRPGEETKLLFRFPEGSGRYTFGSADSVQEDRGFLFRWDVNP